MQLKRLNWPIIIFQWLQHKNISQMPVEIRELIVRVTIEDKPRTDHMPEFEKLKQVKKEIIQECLEKVLQKIKWLEER